MGMNQSRNSDDGDNPTKNINKMKNNKKSENGMVQIPEITLKALKGLLFTEGGVDLTPIVDDLDSGCGNRDLLEIHIALVFKGLVPKIDTATRYEHEWRNSYNRYTYRGFSLIEGMVKVTKETVDNTTNAVTGKAEFFLDYTMWTQLTTNLQEVLDKCKKD